MQSHKISSILKALLIFRSVEMRGDAVVLRVYGGGAALARVWDDFSETVSVLSVERYSEYKQGVSDYWPIGFRRQDVFKCDDAALKMVKAGRMAWDKLTHYAE
ncbi:MAG TPA: hypothetical protein VGH91_08640 [Gammaproteobacteria bacterium]